MDYSVGLPGSQHDATAFAETRVYKECEVLLGEDEWIWADPRTSQEKENVGVESRNVELLEGKLKREELKLSLFRYLYS